MICHHLFEEDRDRINFLSNCTARHPNADIIAPTLLRQPCGNNRGPQRIERLRVPEELCHTDQDVAEQPIDFARLLLQMLDEFGNTACARNRPTPLQTTLEHERRIACRE